MKTSIRTIYLPLALCGALFGVSLSGCDERNVPDSNITTIDLGEEPSNAFQTWLTDNIQKPYNIEYIYKTNPREVDHSYMLTPVRLDKSMMLASAFKYVWLEAYDQVADISFTQANVPRIIMPIGSPAYEDNGTYTLGTAEGGLKVTFYAANLFDPSSPADMNRLFFHTMHHEFGHILHSAKAYDVRYVEISKTDYDQNSWQNRTESSSAQMGFITPYAGSNSEEDFTELAANYITMSTERLNEVLTMAGEGGADGRRKLEEKIEIMKDYMLSAWNIDMDELHADVQNRTANVAKMQLILDPWKEMLDEVAKSGVRATMPPLKAGINNLLDVDRAAKAFYLQKELLRVPTVGYTDDQATHASNLKGYHNPNCQRILQLFDSEAYAKIEELSNHEH